METVDVAERVDEDVRVPGLACQGSSQRLDMRATSTTKKPFERALNPKP